jgi:hypothetical protein
MRSEEEIFIEGKGTRYLGENGFLLTLVGQACWLHILQVQLVICAPVVFVNFERVQHIHAPGQLLQEMAEAEANRIGGDVPIRER